MPKRVAERIKHYNEMLVKQHRFVGGTVLQGYCLRSRVFEWEGDQAYCAWGADYSPLPAGWSWFGRLLKRDSEYDKELGIPATAVCEAWLSIAKKADSATAVTRFEYSTGIVRGLAPHVAVDDSRIGVPFSEINIDHVRGGLGCWRGIPEFPHETTDVDRAEQLATALHSAAGHIIAQSD